MKILVIGNNWKGIKEMQFCLHISWQDVVVVSTEDAQKGIEMVEAELPDVVTVGSTLTTDIDVIEVITRIREFSDVPLMVMAEERNDINNAWYLEAGADDYINMPFNPIEFLAKVRVLLRRTCGLGFNLKQEKPIAIGDRASIDTTMREVKISDKQVKLTPIEYRLLLELARNQGKIVSHKLLMERVWGSDYIDDVDFVKRYIYRLRQKLEPSIGKPFLISERGIGYRLLRA